MYKFKIDNNLNDNKLIEIKNKIDQKYIYIYIHIYKIDNNLCFVENAHYQN